MKCEHCGKNEATFYYKSTVNGRTTEAHLCGQCARELGYDRAMEPMGAFGRNFFRPFSLLEDFFGEGIGGRMLTEFPAPGNTLAEARETAARQEEPALADEAQRRELQAQCRRNALEHRLQAAIESENYEEAARVRDELRALGQ